MRLEDFVLGYTDASGARRDFSRYRPTVMMRRGLCTRPHDGLGGSDLNSCRPGFPTGNISSGYSELNYGDPPLAPYQLLLLALLVAAGLLLFSLHA
jgi:hypothetical protein